MKVDSKEENSRVTSFEKVEIILRCKYSVVETDDEDDSDVDKNNGKTKREGQLDKYTKMDGKEKKKKEEKNNEVNLINLMMKFKEKCSVSEDCSDVISRSPMRTQECHHCCKPYEYPTSASSRSYGGMTRVVEADNRPDPVAFSRHFYGNSQSPHSSEDGHEHDVNLPDISRWLNLCKRDPRVLYDFIEDCNNELSKKEISSFHHYRSSRSISSQLNSPAQSPSEQNLTSPESVTYDENSLYYSKSPNSVPSLDVINIKPSEEEGKRSPGTADHGHLNILPDGTVNEAPERSRSSASVSASSPPECSAFPNIGTVMLNLAQDPYESTIDLNQFATVCDTHNEVGQVWATVERDILNEKLDPKAKENAWARISQLNIDLLGKGDKEGDTQLMILLVSEKVTLEYVYVIVERLLKEHPEYLSSRNELNQDALYLASFKLVWEPLIASYIAEALVRGKQDVNMKYDEGNTLLHCLAKQGDSHAKVLERLVKLRNSNGTYAFDINKKNNRGFTPLQVACEIHKRDVIHSYQTVRIFLENGADSTAKDYKDENTPIHTLINESCDADLLRIYLDNSSKYGRKDGPLPTTVPNRQGNTALHLACWRNTLGLPHQKEVIKLLLRYGAMIQLKNINGCVPSVLVDAARKQEIKTILHSYRQR